MTLCRERMATASSVSCALSSVSRSEKATGMPVVLGVSRAPAVDRDRDALGVHAGHDADEARPRDARERDLAVLAHDEDRLVAIEDVRRLEVEGAREERVTVGGRARARARTPCSRGAASARSSSAMS